MRVALINIQGADDPNLLSRAFTQAFGQEVEVKLFSTESLGENVVQHSAAFVLERLEGNKFSGEGNRAILSRNATERETKLANKMASTGLQISTALEDFDSSRSNEDQKAWIETGSYPVAVVQKPQEEDYSFLFGEDDDDEEDETPAPAPIPTPVVEAPVAAPVKAAEPKRNSGIPIEGGLEEIPLPGVRNTAPVAEPEAEVEAPVYASRRESRVEAPAYNDQEDEIVEAPKYRSIPTDSMSANDAPVPPRRTREIPVSTGPAIPEYLDIDDEPAPLPRRQAPVQQAPVREEAPAPVSAPAPIDLGFDEGDDADYVAPVQRRVAPAPVATPEPIDLGFMDDEPVTPVQRRVAPAPAPEPINLDFDEEIPAAPVRRQAPAPAPEKIELPSWEDFQKQNAPEAPSAPAPVAPRPAPVVVEDDLDDAPAPLPSRRARRAETPVDFDDREDEQEPVTPARRRPEPVYEAPAPVYEAPEPVEAPQARAPRPVEPILEDDEDFTPAPRRQAPVRQQEDEYEAAPAPARRQAPAPAPEPEYEAPAPAPRRPQVRFDDPMGGYEDDEPKRYDPTPYVPPVSDGGRNTMADELDLSDIQSAAAKRAENAEKRRLEREAQEAKESNRVQAPSWQDREPEQEQYNAPARPIQDEMPEAFRRHDTLEEAAFGQQTPDGRTKRPMQSVMEEMKAEFGASAGKFTPASESAFIIYVTGSRGGAGKTTVAYLLSQVLASACKKAGRGEEVYLVEGDYENPKLAQRLALPRSQNLGELARFYEGIQQDRSLPGGNNRFQVDATGRNIIDKITYEMPDSGLKVLACPYDLTTRKSTTIRLAMQKAITQVAKTAKYIVIDGDTLSNDDILDRELIAKAHHTIIVAWGNSDEDMGDGVRSAHTLKTAEASGGMGIPAKRVSMFFNRTEYAKVEEIKVKIRPLSVSGYIPDLPDFKDTWIGAVEPTPNFHNAVACVAKAANTIYPNDDLIPFANRQFSKTAPGTTGKKRGGLFGFLRNKG